MPCANCGNQATIKAHLIPRVFCCQVQPEKSHAAQTLESGAFQVSQSGAWDRDILCAECDNKLGEHENYSHKVFLTVREHGSGEPWQCKFVEGVDYIRILRFCCGILYKYSLTESSNGRISLGRYQQVCRDVAFGTMDPPNEIDALVWRPLRHDGDQGQFAYRAPFPDRTNGINLYRLMVGGIVIFIKLDRRPTPGPEKEMMLQAAREFVYMTVPAAGLEEYEIPRRLIAENEKLSRYLDKVEGFQKE